MKQQRKDSNSYCYRVKGLFIPYATPENIDNDINNYISKIERCTADLDDRYNKNDRNGFLIAANSIMDLLQPVYAKQCISYINALIESAKNTSHDLTYCERLLQQSVADLLLLSIEMQKAQKINFSHAIKYKNIEKNQEIASSMASISRLLAFGKYEDAASMAYELKELNESFIKLADMIKTRQFDRAKELADTLEKEHIRIIQKPATTNNSSKTILAVDDRPEILQNVNAALRNHYKVLGAPAGKQALQIMERQKIHLFYLDIEMPEMDGFELLQKIRANPNYTKTPILFLTSNASRENITRGISLGVNDYIVKPSNHVNLLVKARKYMDE